MTDELKPVRCGCGGEAKIKKVSDDCYAVYCKKCVIHTGHYWHEEDAIEAWNRAMGGTSAEPERKTGMWIVQPSTGEDRPFIWWKCSECGQVIFSETERDRREFHAFCGRCGADMRGEHE